MDIKDKAKRYPDELSAGEQQRVGIARALVNKPRVLICDEPTGNLDPITAMEIMELLNQINIRGTTVLMVTHDIVDKMNKRVVAIEHGHIVRDEEGSYGYRKQKTPEQELYIPGIGYNAAAVAASVNTGSAEQFFVPRSMDPKEAIEAERRQTMYLDQDAAETLMRQTQTITSADPAVDDMLSAYLNGGEDVYE